MRTLYYRFRALLVTLALRLLPRRTPVTFMGIDSALTLVDQIAVFGFRRVLIVSDRILHDSGLLDSIKTRLTGAGVGFAVFDGVLPDPGFDQVEAGARALRECEAEAVLAVGGGSVLDAAKMIAMLHTNPGTLADFEGVQKSANPAVPLFAAPTTAGTGSEISPVAVISDPADHRKVLVVDTRMLPWQLALDPRLMQSMPPGVTAASGMDALTHAVEAYLSTAATAATDAEACAAVKLVFANLPRACSDGDDLPARENMALAAFYAGSAMSRTAVGYVHAIAHQLGRVCGTPHGNANAMVLPEVLSAYGACVHPRLAQLARHVGLAAGGGDDDALAARFIQAISELRSRLDLPLLPRGLKPGALPDIINAALDEAGSVYPVPRYLDAREIGGILKGLLPAAEPRVLELRRHG